MSPQISHAVKTARLKAARFSLLFFVCLFWMSVLNAQDSSRLRISLLTCTPGEELYSTFGHSALRVTDSNAVTDLVYNYGTFNFDDEGFYLKFARGKLLYYVSVELFRDFAANYQYENRGITEQVLNLSGEEKIRMRHFLEENLQPQNRYYKYDFFFDNCTTRLRDILKHQHDSFFCLKPVMPAGTRFRQAIHRYLDKNQQPWSKLGIDILLGQPCDAVMTAEQMQFLPDNLMNSIDSSSHPFVLSEKNLYPINKKDPSFRFFTPFLFFSALLILIVILAVSGSNLKKILLPGFDGLLFFLTGLLGIVLLFMWTATDHAMCRNNYNLLWALPTHAVMAFWSNSSKAWARTYFKITGILLLLLLLAWFFLPQQLNPALIPLVLLLAYRSLKTV